MLTYPHVYLYLLLTDLVSRTLANYMQLLDRDEADPVPTLLQLSGTWSCLICLSTVRRMEAVWSCDQCCCLFHLMCIQQWAQDSLRLVQPSPLSPELFPELDTIRNWSCPKCRRDYSRSQIPQHYYCFCRKKVRDLVLIMNGEAITLCYRWTLKWIHGSSHTRAEKLATNFCHQIVAIAVPHCVILVSLWCV